MATTRKQYSPKFKAKVALEQLPDLFVDGRKNNPAGADVEEDALYARRRGQDQRQ